MIKKIYTIIINFIDNLIYFILYYLFYKFSGAHNKPTSDSCYDPTLEHQNNIFYRLLRSYEKKKLNSFKKNKEISNINDKLITHKLPNLVLTYDNEENKKMFLLKTNNKRSPIVIKGLIANCEACQKWSPDFFENKYGDTKLLTLKKGDKFKTNAYTSFTQKMACDYMSLKDSIKNMINNNNDLTYINNVTEIFSKHPELIKDLGLNNISKIDTSINEESWLKVNLFMGGPRTGSSLHCAVAGNFFFNVYGKKKWILISPYYSKYLQSTPAENFEFVISGYNIEDMDQFGTLNQLIPKYEIILEPGDVLYVPPWYWHYVHNETDFTIGCAIRDHTVYTQSILNNPIFMLQSPYIYRLNPIILGMLKFLKGRNFLLQKSMDSDKYIMKNLTGEFIESEK